MSKESSSQTTVYHWWVATNSKRVKEEKKRNWSYGFWLAVSVFDAEMLILQQQRHQRGRNLIWECIYFIRKIPKTLAQDVTGSISKAQIEKTRCLPDQFWSSLFSIGVFHATDVTPSIKDRIHIDSHGGCPSCGIQIPAGTTPFTIWVQKGTNCGRGLCVGRSNLRCGKSCMVNACQGRAVAWSLPAWKCSVEFARAQVASP